jgi:hypothetical protein
MKSKSIKEAKSKLVPLPKLKKKAQDIFNKWIRNRDKEERCISCGGPVEQAGHYFSSGHFSALTFNEMNVNGQDIRCNMFLNGNLIYYRQGLVRKYGVNAVIELEKKAEVRTYKWSRTELEEIIQKYKL